ncbi:hypothetical protein [Vibrio pectenicida]|uniref:hypothetical protein n=1 Tax=Vibrio pectenicida TaxID=62763 RepID=UPI0030812C94
MHVYNPFFNTKTTISDVDQLAERLLALSDTDAQVINDLLSLTQQDTSLLNKLNQQASLLTQQSKDIAELKTDVNHAQALANASSENLLINPRGKINQADESAGVLSAGVYFCDGWKAGENGAEVYRDADGFRLVSGSIVQLVPNDVDPNKTLRGNMTMVSGAPQIKINSGTDTAQNDSRDYIQFEVVGDNTKFTRLILAESKSLPIYHQLSDELTPCLRFLRVFKGRTHRYLNLISRNVQDDKVQVFHMVPAASWLGLYNARTIVGTIDGFQWDNAADTSAALYVDDLKLDARP